MIHFQIGNDPLEKHSAATRLPYLNWPFPSRSPPFKKHSAAMHFLYRKWSFSSRSPPTAHSLLENRLNVDSPQYFGGNILTDLLTDCLTDCLTDLLRRTCHVGPAAGAGWPGSLYPPTEHAHTPAPSPVHTLD